MEKGVLFAVLILAVMLFSMGTVCAENFTDLSREITDNSYIVLNDDVVLNQHSSNEHNIYMEGIPIVSKDISIDGNGHEISGKDSNSNQVRIFNIKNSTVTLSNMVIRFAAADGSGGAVSFDKNSTLILRNVTFKNNSALGLYGEGGAVYAGGTLFVYDCVFEDNYATGTGGAIFAPIFNCSIYSSRFTSNAAEWYGGALSSGAVVNVDSSIFDSNKAYSGGAFHHSLCSYSLGSGKSFFTNSNFTSNDAYFGGAISSSTFYTIVNINCNFVDNRATKGGVFYKSARTIVVSFDSCLIENNSAEIAAFFYDDGFLEFSDELFSTTKVDNCILRNNVASVMSSVFYGRSAIFWVNNTGFYSNLNKPIYNGIGNITVMNSIISNYSADFITQFLGGNVIFINNTCEAVDSNADAMLDLSADSHLITQEYCNNDLADSLFTFIPESDDNLDDDGECCSVYLRLNQTDFTISHRRDGGINLTINLDKNGNFIRQFKPSSEYFLLSKVYTNGWVIGAGGWDDSCENEKIEAIASDMVKNQNINLEALELILSIKRSVTVGHLLIVAPDGTYGNVISYKGNDFLKMGVLDDGDYIISPNSPDFWCEDHLDNIEDVVESNINLSAGDEYGFERHCILVHHINLDESGFSDALYVSNEDGSLVNGTDNYNYVDNFWFKEKFTPRNEIPVILDYLYLGTFYDLNKTVVSQNVTRGYNCDYDFKAQFLNRDGDLLANTKVKVNINGKSTEYVTDDKGILKIHFTKLTATQNIVLTNPVTGEVVKNTINVVPRLVGSDVVMDYSAESKYIVKVYGEDGNPAGENEVVTVRLDGKTYEIRTDSNGIATFAIPDTLMPGTYDLEASYGGQTIKNTVEVRQTHNNVSERPLGRPAIKSIVKTSMNDGFKKMKVSLRVTVNHGTVNGTVNDDFLMNWIKNILKNPFDLIYLCLIAPLLDLKIAQLPLLLLLLFFAFF